nr:hypothetical protein [Tanacetum cinerariifolium]
MIYDLTYISPTLGKSLYVDPSQYLDDPNMPALEDITYSNDEEDVGVEADFSNLEITITVSPIPTTRVHQDHPVTQIIGDLSIATQTRSMTRMVKDQGGLTQINNKDFILACLTTFFLKKNPRGLHTCMFDYFLSQEEPKRVHQVLKDPSWIEAMQEELLQFKMQKVWVLMDLPKGKRAIRSKWVFRNKKDERGIVVRNKARLVYVDDIIFSFTNKDLCKAFEKFMKDKSQMSSMGELTFFLGLQDKYVAKILRKFSLTDGKSASTHTDIKKPLLKDPDVKRIIRYLKGKLHLGLWYLKDSPFNLVAYSNSEYAGASLDRKSTTGGCQFLGRGLISWQYKKQTVVATSSTEAKYVSAASCCNQVNAVIRLQALIDRKKVITTEDTVREALYLDDAESIDCLPNEDIFVELARMGYEKPSTKLTFYKAFFSAQWKFLILITL